MSENKTPNWEMIQNSPVWEEQIKPFIDEMRTDTLELRAGQHHHPFMGSETPTLEEYHYWRGYCAALKAVSGMPEEMIEANRRFAAEEKKDVLIQQNQDSLRTYRRQSA